MELKLSQVEDIKRKQQTKMTKVDKEKQGIWTKKGFVITRKFPVLKGVIVLIMKIVSKDEEPLLQMTRSRV